MPQRFYPGTTKKRAFYFDARLYGSPNFEAEGGYFGIRRFQKIFDEAGNDNRLLPEYRGMLRFVGRTYAKKVAKKFAEKHGRTGTTEENIASPSHQFEGSLGGNPDAFLYRIEVGANIGFVVYPIPRHTIEAHTGVLFNTMSGPWKNRTTNFYESLPPGVIGGFKRLEWFQGGPESHSPDVSWTFDAETRLLAKAEFSKLAARVQAMWTSGSDLNSEIPISRPAHNEFFF